MPWSVAAKATTPGISPALAAARSTASIWGTVLGSNLVGASARARVALRRLNEANAVSAVVFTISRRLGRWIMTGPLRTGRQRHTAASADLPRTDVRRGRKGVAGVARADEADAQLEAKAEKAGMVIPMPRPTML